MGTTIVQCGSEMKKYEEKGDLTFERDGRGKNESN